MKLGGFRLSELTLESRGLSPLQKHGDKCCFFPLLLNDLAKAVAFIAFASYVLRFIKTRSRYSVPTHHKHDFSE